MSHSLEEYGGLFHRGIYKTCSEDEYRVMDDFGVFSKPDAPVDIEIDEAEFGCGRWVESEIQ